AGGGRAGLRRDRWRGVGALEACPLFPPGLAATDVLDRHWPGTAEVAVAGSVGTGETVVLADGVAQGRSRLVELAGGRRWRVDGAGFWQVHPGAADTLLSTVRTGLQPRPGEHLLDLYSGVGLFAGTLAEELGPGGRVDAVEADQAAVRAARRNLHAQPTVRLHQDRVEHWLATSGVARS